MSTPVTTAAEAPPAGTAPLSRLRSGDDYPGGSINARKTVSEEGLPELLASMLAHGQIHPLRVKTHANGKVYVGAGNRRLKAFRLGVKMGRVAKNHPVKVQEIEDGVDAAELSLAENVMRLPMHEVDQYEAFVGLRDAGSSPADIASRFGTSEIVVKRRLALGSLSPKLRQAWREDKIRAEAAMAFTVVEDYALQEAAYTSLAQGQMLQRHSIIRALIKSDGAQAGALRFVGVEAYEAAGGRVSRDLFKEEQHVLDPEILARLERAKVEAAIAELRADGWAWAALTVETPHDRFHWSRIRPEPRYTEAEEFRRVELQAVIGLSPKDPGFDVRALEDANGELARLVDAAVLRAFTAEDRAASGCLLVVDGDGELDVEFGVIRPPSDLAGIRSAAPGPGGPTPALPRDASDRAADEGERPAPEEVAAASAPEISGALAGTVSEWLTLAAADALADEPDLALRVLLAALQSYGAPARFSRAGWHGLRDGMRDKAAVRNRSFAEEFGEALRSTMPHLKAALAAEVAHSLDLTTAAAHHPAMAVKGGAALVDALDPEGYLKAARRCFRPDVYFDRAPAAVAVAAVAEMGGPKPTGNKGRVALAASDLAGRLGWLPPGMRSAAYVPPRVPAAPATAEGTARGRRAAPAGAPSPSA